MTQVTGTPLNVDDVARELQHSRSVVMRWARSGELPMYKVGKIWLINPETFDQWKRARQVGLTVTAAAS
jgi:excisionase family DNA binding protein